MQNESEAETTGNEEDRWALLRDIAVLQVKLVVDGARDLVLVPISLVAGLISLAKANFGSDNVSILLGDGLGGFVAATSFPVGARPFDVTAGHFDGD